MIRRLRFFSVLILLHLLLLILCTQDGHSQMQPVFKAIKAEMQRTMNQLRSQQRPPYYLSYCVTDVRTVRVATSFGNLDIIDTTQQRVLDIDMRVGDYRLDNTHVIRGLAFDFSGGNRNGRVLPQGDDEMALRTAIWNATDRAYKSSIERYGKVLANKAVKVKEEDSSADFSREKPTRYFDTRSGLTFSSSQWQNIMKRLSALFARDPKIYVGRMYFQADINTKYFVNSEGSEIVTVEPIVKLFIQASTKADDGMTLPLYRSYTAFSTERLPTETELMQDCESMIALLGKLRNAPLAETYTGPAILSGRSSGVFFHEIFGHRVEGHRQKDPNSSQTFKSFVNKKILPDFINVIFDPTIKQRDGVDLVGYFTYDDEGVEGKKVVAVEKGIFKNFLMSRSPIDGFDNSNGHGRRQAGFRCVARQSNLVVESSSMISYDSLRQDLRRLCLEQKKEYGLLFEDISGGFTFTGRTVPNAFNVQPLVVYKIFADGRADELVRGVDLIGTPLATFNNIVATSNPIGIFNGVCGAESGGVPVSASSPALLVSTIEVQKKAKSQAKPPLISSPQQPSKP